MIVENLSSQKPFTTKDGSLIRSILGRTNAPVKNQSLAEAAVPQGGSTQRHYHKISEEIYLMFSLLSKGGASPKVAFYRGNGRLARLDTSSHAEKRLSPRGKTPMPPGRTSSLALFGDAPLSIHG